MHLGHRRLSEWYFQLAQQLDAGLTLVEALRASSTVGTLGAAMAGQIERGGSTDDALRIAEGRIPLGDQLSLSAAAEIGRMPALLRTLAERHRQIAAAKIKVVLACVYPLAVLHLGLLLFPLLRMIDWEKGLQWSWARYVRDVLLTVGPLWAAVFLVIVLARRGSPIVTAVARRLPAVGGYVRWQALADFCFMLGNFVEAGVPIGRAWAASGLVSADAGLKRAAEAMADAVERGQPPGPRLATCPQLPADFATAYRTGETSGKLDAALQRLSRTYQEKANATLMVATIVYPLAMFLGVAAMVAANVISIYAGYLKMLTKLAE